jgi:hypothetical protein
MITIEKRADRELHHNFEINWSYVFWWSTGRRTRLEWAWRDPQFPTSTRELASTTHGSALDALSES